MKSARMAMVLAAFLMVGIFGGISVAAAPQESGTSVTFSQVVGFHGDDPLPGPCSIPGGDPEHPCSIPGGDPEHPCSIPGGDPEHPCSIPGGDPEHPK